MLTRKWLVIEEWNGMNRVISRHYFKFFAHLSAYASQDRADALLRRSILFSHPIYKVVRTKQN